jgi:hypothetical protein
VVQVVVQRSGEIQPLALLLVVVVRRAQSKATTLEQQEAQIARVLAAAVLEQ